MSININELLRMKNQLCFLIAIFCLSACSNVDSPINSDTSLLPLPQKVIYSKGLFEINAKTKIVVPNENQEILELGKLLSEFLAMPAALPVTVMGEETGEKEKNTIFFKMDDTLPLKDEGYRLTVTEKKIVISAKTSKGMFSGLQTLRQLLPADVEKSSTAMEKWHVPCLEIEDEPSFEYRGVLIDVARHFYPKEIIKRQIEILSYYKINNLQLHLTDDQGWRIEIKKYPKLTEIGSFRDETLVGKYTEKEEERTFDGERYGGYYTQEDIKEIVNHAKKYYVNIIPEIEMPGHSVAALTAYPELGCTGGPYNVRTYWGISDDIQCAGNENTFQFVDDVLTEVAGLFPSEYIHIGGDEAPKERWKQCVKCQKRIQDEGLKDEHELQSYYIHRVEKILEAKGKKLIGWDEILEGGLTSGATVMSWRGTKGGIEAAKMGNNVIMSPNTHCYLDYYQSEDRENEPLAIGGHLPLSMVYSFEPYAGLTVEESKFILGGQANVWTEYIKTPEHLEYMIFPRACALAEVLWTNAEVKDFENFSTRMTGQEKRLKLMGVNFRKIEEQ